MRVRTALDYSETRVDISPMRETAFSLLFIFSALLLYLAISWLSYVFFNASDQYRNRAYWALGLKTKSSDDSNFRRMMSRLSLLISVITLIGAIGVNIFNVEYQVGAFDYILVVAFPLASIWFFFSVVLLMPFRQGEKFDVNIQRLLYDSFVSAIFMIATFSIIYTYYEFCSGKTCTQGDRLNSIYFSAVTFSTLGFGDFSPSPSSRPFAAIQAILGNLHLGMIAGATFAALTKKQAQ